MRSSPTLMVHAAAALVCVACSARQPPVPVASPSDEPASAAADAQGRDAAGRRVPGVEPGVSRELALHRAATLSDVAYDLSLDLTARDGARGAVVISVERSPAARALVLDFRGTALHAAHVNGDAVEQPAWDGHHVTVPEHLLRQGRNELSFEFTAPIAAAGAAIIAYDDRQDDARYLYTLLVPSDAQLLFPVFDQPDIKARFTWQLTVPDGWRGLTNGAERGRVRLPSGDWRLSFATTQPISTYAAAFAAGPWTVLPAPLDSAAPDAGSPVQGASPGRGRANADALPAAAAGPAEAMTLWTRRSVAAAVDADTLLALNRSALAWLERYFDYEYPFDKLDLLLAPAFPFGGMEHVGAIFYNESTFIFREPPTLSRRLARAATIYHEVAHQWFGDLVTMEWFDDLWLKEGFSTFMAARIQDELHPASNAWKTFYIRNKPLAYGVDVTAGTTPVWQELPNLDLAKSNYGPIVYNKAPAILKQLEFLVGEEAFRDGLRTFLRRHAYANATWRDLLAAIGEAAGTDLRSFGRHYILRAGAPIVETQLQLAADGSIASLTLHQRPALELPDDDGGWWPGRVRVRLGYAGDDDVLVDVAFRGHRTPVPEVRGLPAPDYVLANDGDYGYGIFLPDASSSAWLLEHAPELRDDLLRALAWGALWDLVREQRLPPYLFATAAIRGLDAERDEQIAGLLLARVMYALERYIPVGQAHAHLAALLEALLLQRVDDASLDYGLRRSALDALLASARSEEAVAVLHDYLAGRRGFDDAPLGQPSRWAAVTRLLVLDDPRADALYRAEQARDSTPEAARMAFMASAASASAANKADLFERYLSDDSLNEEWVTASLAAFNHPLHAQLALPYLQRALERAEWLRDNRRIFFLPRWLDAFIGGHASTEALAVVDAHLATHAGMPVDVRRRILQARDELARSVAVRTAFPPF
jgi:aminopeptidase N